MQDIIIDKHILDFGSGDAAIHISIVSNSLNTQIQNDNYELSSVSTSQSFQLNTWYHIAYTLNGNTATIYINGISVGSISNSISPDNIITTSNFFGKDGGNLMATSLILDEVRIYKGAMTSNQVLTDYNNIQLVTSKFADMKKFKT